MILCVRWFSLLVIVFVIYFGSMVVSRVRLLLRGFIVMDCLEVVC